MTRAARRKGKALRSASIARHSIAGKEVYVFESHNLALIPWAECRRRLGQKPRLFTLDFHTDTQPAFQLAAAKRCGTAYPNAENPQLIAQEMVAAVQFDDPNSVITAAGRLRYDEQIDAAIRTNILEIAFVAAHSDYQHIESDQQQEADKEWRAAPEFSSKIVNGATIYVKKARKVASGPCTYSLPDNGIVVLPRVSLPNGRLDADGRRGELYDRDYRDAALEDERLCAHVDLVNTICESAVIPGLYEAPYILDLDLDYFNTRRSIEPRNPTEFYRLIRGAAAITVARESACVKLCRLEGERVTSSSLEKALMQHIEAAAG